MKNFSGHTVLILTLMVILTFSGPGPKAVHAADYCSNDIATPPFLSGGVDPNLLLMIDNSGSMLDLAYVVDGSTCYDDSFSGATTYAGYFDPGRLYIYDLANRRFRLWEPSVYALWPAAHTEYYYTVNVVYVKLGGAPAQVTGFIASGNFLNWASASKLDIQKEILTGGKYEAAGGMHDPSGTGSHLIMETRGCGNRRFVKEVAVTDLSTGNPRTLTLAVRPSREPDFPAWTPNTAYAVGEIVDEVGDLYIATAAGTSGALGVDNDNTTYAGGGGTPAWSPYTATRWTNGATYTVGSIVSDPQKYNTIDEGQMYIAVQVSGPASGTGVDDDTNITWVPYNVTQIEVFQVSDNGFNNSACQTAVTLLATGGSQGLIKDNIDDCMGYVQGGASSLEANSNAAFNHAIHNCWYRAKQGIWPPGAGAVSSQKNACADVYGDVQPWAITTEDTGYGCYGVHDSDSAAAGLQQLGYVGRCWQPGTPLVCVAYFTSGSKAGQCKTWSGGVGGGWDATGLGGDIDRDGIANEAGDDDVNGDGVVNEDDCVEQALIDYCVTMEIPEVVDPSDQVNNMTLDTEGFWNIPAVLIDSGVVAQLNNPRLVMRGLIEEPSAPQGLLQEFAGDLRIGAMVFNYEGSQAECSLTDPFVLYNCADANNKDSGKLIAAIDKSAAHTTDLVNAINDIKATSWTPIAEAIYSAIGYYAQRDDMVLDGTSIAASANLKISGVTAPDPVTAYCQDNNILIITEGASTADVNPDMISFVSAAGRNDGDTGDTTAATNCGALNGSTLLDDLTWFANSAGCHTAQINDAEGNPQDKQAVATHIVVAGTLRDTGTTDECNPYQLLARAAANGGTSLYQAADPNTLKNTLRAAFAAIRAGAAAGSAASVISASRGGEGAAYQAIFWPGVDLAGGDKVEWIGEVHALLVDSAGFLYEDTNGNGAFESGTDQRVVFFFNLSDNQTYACVGGEVDNNGNCINGGVVKTLEDVKYHWSAAQWLSEVTPVAAVGTAAGSEDILQNRNLVGSTVNYISNTKKRFIFTWSDLDNDGAVDAGEVIDFVPGAKTWSATGLGGTRGAMTLDFGVSTDAEVNQIIRWVRGLDETAAGLRLRQMPYDFDHDNIDTQVTWRLGDVIHSTPISVGAPAEGFHFLYRDASYADFVSQYKARRHMIYFGGNDGMLHAVNGGFFDEVNTRFCRSYDTLGRQYCTTESSAPELGAELWAYVPYNLLPHLGCMTRTGYQHKYYVDQRPRIFDVRIFPDDADHPNGWGTILVGAMRLGGGRLAANTIDPDNNGPDYPADNRQFTSAYFILDITNPEKPPVLLAEMTRTGSEAEMGYTTPIPTLAVMKNGTSTAGYQWYLVLGSGPTDLNGISNQNGKVAVFPLNRLVSSPRGHFRIPDALPADTDEFGRFTLSSANSFISDLVSVDFELEADYKTDVVYFGTVSGTAAPFGGTMHRLVTSKIDSVTLQQEETEPSDWDQLLNPVSLTNPLPLIDAGQPVTASASVGFDGKNYWVFFGSGRFMDTSDKSDASQQTYYGIKEPLDFAFNGPDCKGTLNWKTVQKLDVTDASHNSSPGSQGLLRVDQIQVSPAASAYSAALSCKDGTTDCLQITPTTLGNFNDLLTYIGGSGTGCDASDSTGTDGWYKRFLEPRERNLGQATLLGGLLTYTTYQPYSDACLPEGLGYLYGVFFQTGTPFYVPVFVSDYSTGVDGSGKVIEQVALGRGLATTPNLHVGKQEGSKAFVQTSTGTIVEIPQPNLPIPNAKTGKSSWGEVK